MQVMSRTAAQGGAASMKGAIMSGSIRGQVLDSKDGTPIQDAAIVIVQSAGNAPDIAPVTDERGTFSLEGLPRGRWTLRAIGPDGETGEATVFVRDGAESNLVIQMGARDSDFFPETE